MKLLKSPYWSLVPSCQPPNEDISLRVDMYRVDALTFWFDGVWPSTNSTLNLKFWQCSRTGSMSMGLMHYPSHPGWVGSGTNNISASNSSGVRVRAIYQSPNLEVFHAKDWSNLNLALTLDCVVHGRQQSPNYDRVEYG